MTRNNNRNSAGRDSQGRFAVGNPGGPGRPPRMTEEDYLRTLAENISLDDWAAIIRKAVDDAKSGEAKSREWLSRYLIGSPTEAAPTLFDLLKQEVSGETSEERARRVNAFQRGERPGDSSDTDFQL